MSFGKALEVDSFQRLIKSKRHFSFDGFLVGLPCMIPRFSRAFVRATGVLLTSEI